MEISSTKNGKIRFWIKALKMNLLGKLSSCPGFQEMVVRIPYSHPNLPLIILQKKTIKVKPLPVIPPHLHQIQNFNTIIQSSRANTISQSSKCPSTSTSTTFPWKHSLQLRQWHRYKQRLAHLFILASRCHGTLKRARPISLKSLLQSMRMSSLGI